MKIKKVQILEVFYAFICCAIYNTNQIQFHFYCDFGVMSFTQQLMM